MDDQLLNATLLVLKKFWQMNFEKNEWHGYGLRKQDVELRAALFVQGSLQNRNALRRALIESVQSELKDKTPPFIEQVFEFLETPRLRSMHTGTRFRRTIPYRPGARVFVTSDRCGQGCFGTIGGFLKKAGAGATEPVWLVTNHHILADDEKCASQATVHGSGGKLLSNQIKFVALQMGRPNDVDAAIAKISDPGSVSGSYPGLSITCPSPTQPRDKMPVQKLGNATNVTSGILVWCCPKVVITSCNGNVFEFENQIVIGSKSKTEPFLAHGDSGSLVVGDGHPVGLLHAIGLKAILPSEVQAIAPLGLASPFGTVLKELGELGELGDKTRLGPLELILDSSPTSCVEHDGAAMDNCIAFLNES